MGGIAKIEPMLETDAAVRALVAAFEACTLPYANWTHRAHLAVATTYLVDGDAAAALAHVRDGIERYNRTCGDPLGYNETVTRLYIRRIDADLRMSGYIARCRPASSARRVIARTHRASGLGISA